MTNKPMSKVDRRVVAYTDWIIRYRWFVVVSILTLSAFAIYGAKDLTFTNDYRVFFSKENPQLNAFEEVQDTYNKNDNALIVLTPSDGNVFTPETLAVIEEITEEAWGLPFAMRVDSISNFQHTQAEEDDLIVEDLYSDAANLSATEISRIKAIAMSEPLLANRLISDRGHVTSVNVTFQMPGKGLKEVSEVTSAVRALAERVEADYPFIKTHLTGIVFYNAAFFESSQNDLKNLVPIMYLGIIIVMLLLVRCVSSTFATVVVIALSIATTMGISTYFGLKLTGPSASAPTVIMTLAVADSIHIIISMFAAMRHGMGKLAAIKESMRINMQPVFITSATTTIGFLTLNFSDAPPFRDLGNLSALGVMIAFVLSVTILPALLSILPCRKKVGESKEHRWIDSFADFVIAKRHPLLIVMVLLSIGMIAFIPKNELNDEFVKYFSERIEFRQDTDYTVDNLTGLYQIQYSIPADGANGVSDPEFLSKLEAFANWYRQQPEVIHISTISDTFKRLNKNLHGDDESFYKIPESRQEAAQYLLLYELSLPFGLDLNNQLNIDKSKTQFIATVDSLSSLELKDLVSRSDAWFEANAPEMFSTGIGVSVMFAHISGRNINSMFKGAILGLLLISALLVFALRSLKLGALSLIPNLLPIGITFGVWGIFVSQIDIAASIVAGMILGIIVDDTVHFLSKYLRAQRDLDLNAKDAVRYAFHTVGVALIVNTLILVAGFLILARSDFAVNATMGTLTAMGIAIALIIDFLLLPPLLIALEGKPNKQPALDAKEKSYA